MSTCPRPPIWRWLIEGELQATAKVSRALWEYVAERYDVAMLTFAPALTGTSFHNAKSCLLLDCISPCVLLVYVEQLVDKGVLTRKDVVEFEERLLAATDHRGNWK